MAGIGVPQNLDAVPESSIFLFAHKHQSPFLRRKNCSVISSRSSCYTIVNDLVLRMYNPNITCNRLTSKASYKHPTCSQSKLSTEFRANSTASPRELMITAFAPHNHNLDTSLDILTPHILIDPRRLLQPTIIKLTPQTDPRFMNPHNTLVPQSLKRLLNRQIHHTPAPAHVLHLATAVTAPDYSQPSVLLLYSQCLPANQHRPQDLDRRVSK